MAPKKSLFAGNLANALSLDELLVKYGFDKNKKLMVCPDKIKQAVMFDFYKTHPVEFIEDCCVLAEAGGDKLIKLETPQKKVVKTFYKDHYIIFKKSRRIGITTVFRCVCAHLMIFHNNINIGVVSKSGKDASSFCRDTNTMMTKIPYDWIRPIAFSDNNVRMFSLPNGSKLTTAAVSLAAPDNTFRGESLTVLIMDEVAFIHKVDQAWTSISPALGLDHETARKAGVPFGTVFISTPNKKTGRGQFYYREWVRAVNGESNFIPMQIHWTEMKRCTKEWYKKQCADLGNPQKIAQELDLKFIGDEDSIWSEETQTKLNDISDRTDTNIKKIPFTTIGPNTELVIFDKKLPDPENFYFIGIDCAGAAGKDWFAVQIVNYETLEQVAEFRGKIEPLKFAKIIKTILKMFPNNLVIVENNGGYAELVLAELVYDVDTNHNIYGETRLTGEGTNKKQKFVYGLSNNAVSRQLIIESLFNQVTENTDKVKSKLLALELLSLVYKNDKIQADVGFHDDLAMAYAFIFYILNYQKDFYMELVKKSNRKQIAKDGIEFTSSTSFIENFVDDLNKNIVRSSIKDETEIYIQAITNQPEKKNKSLMEKQFDEITEQERKRMNPEDEIDNIEYDTSEDYSPMNSLLDLYK